MVAPQEPREGFVLLPTQVCLLRASGCAFPRPRPAGFSEPALSDHLLVADRLVKQGRQPAAVVLLWLGHEQDLCWLSRSDHRV